MFSGGVGSWAAAKRVAETHGTDDLVLLFADTLIEDKDLYRFLPEAAANVGGELVRIAEGRTPWEVFKDERLIGNTWADPCSKILKRKFIRRWITDRYDPTDVVVYLGIDWTESHRLDRARPYWEPWQIEAPLCDEPYLDKQDVLKWLNEQGIETPRLYKLGMPHNNCGGACVKAGKAQWKRLLEVLPDVYQDWETKEQEMRDYLGKDVAILRDRRNGATKPETLKTWRERLQGSDQLTLDESLDWGGCGCAVD